MLAPVHLGCHDTDRITTICVMLPKVSMTSKADIFVAETADSFANKLRQWKCSIKSFCTIGVFNEADTLESSSILIYSQSMTGLYSQ